jgi:hypothetical protein
MGFLGDLPWSIDHSIQTAVQRVSYAAARSCDSTEDSSLHFTSLLLPK